MKKTLIFVLLTFSVLLLSGCSVRPFKAPSGYTYTQENIISYDYYNGSGSIKLFEFAFDNTYNFFISDDGFNYRFTTINNYAEISDEFIRFLEQYDDIHYDRYLNETGSNKIELSLGATEDDYNSVNVSIDDEVYDVDAFIVVENGLRVIFSYTEFYHDGVLIIVPYHFAILAYEIHEAYLKEYLDSSNKYVDEKAILIKYTTSIIPFPPKVGFWPAEFDGYVELKELGRFMRIIEDTEDGFERTEVVCSDAVTENCFESEYSTLNGFIYNMTIDEVVTYYEENHGGRYDGDNFIFFADSVSYNMILGETTVSIDYANDVEQTEDVVTFEITKYNE